MGVRQLLGRAGVTCVLLVRLVLGSAFESEWLPCSIVGLPQPLPAGAAVHCKNFTTPGHWSHPDATTNITFFAQRISAVPFQESPSYGGQLWFLYGVMSPPTPLRIYLFTYY